MHDWYGPGVRAYACNTTQGEHICMRARIESTRISFNPGPHRCACKHRWDALTPCGKS